MPTSVDARIAVMFFESVHGYPCSLEIIMNFGFRGKYGKVRYFESAVLHWTDLIRQAFREAERTNPY
jgi:hypothetical protein